MASGLTAGPGPGTGQDEGVVGFDCSGLAQFAYAGTGVEVPRHRKVPCPFHPDAQPSLHVYDTAARGWYWTAPGARLLTAGCVWWTRKGANWRLA